MSRYCTEAKAPKDRDIMLAVVKDGGTNFMYVNVLTVDVVMVLEELALLCRPLVPSVSGEW